MADRETLFVKTAASVVDEAKLLQDLLELEPIPNQGGAGEKEFGLRCPARTVEGTLGLEVQPNWNSEDDPDPEDVQAFDGYPVQIDVWLGGRGAEQQQEGRLVFDLLVEARPDVPMLFCHTLDRLIAAYLPGRGVYEFPPDTSVDAPHSHRWKDWVAQ